MEKIHTEHLYASLPTDWMNGEGPHRTFSLPTEMEYAVESDFHFECKKKDFKSIPKDIRQK